MFRELGYPGNHPRTYLFKKLHVFTRKLYPRQQWTSTQPLPPCLCLFMYTMNANYQAGIWRCSLQQHHQVPIPVKRGRVRNDDGQLTVEWMRGSPAPETVLQLLLCKCSRRCKLPKCQCMCTDLKCSNLCKLQTCDNQLQEEHLGI